MPELLKIKNPKNQHFDSSTCGLKFLIFKNSGHIPIDKAENGRYASMCWGNIKV